jgi:hypothetical protein
MTGDAGVWIIAAYEFQVRAADACQPDADQCLAGFFGAGNITQGKSLIFEADGVHGNSFPSKDHKHRCLLILVIL